MEQELQNEASLGLGLPKAVPLIARFLTKLTGQIKTGDAVKTEIRRKLDSRISQLIQGINDLLDRAQVEVRGAGKQGVVVIVDNLDFGSIFERLGALYAELVRRSLARVEGREDVSD